MIDDSCAIKERNRGAWLLAVSGLKTAEWRLQGFKVRCGFEIKQRRSCPSRKLWLEKTHSAKM